MKKTILVALLTATLAITSLGATGCRGRDRGAQPVPPAGAVAPTGAVAPAAVSTPAPLDSKAMDGELAGVDELLNEIDAELANADRSPVDTD
jgi:hypothetical protein